MNREEALQRICQAGITSLGGGASPTHLRIRQAVGKTEVLIVNAAECEPYLTADHRLLLEKGDQILQAVQMLSRLVRAEKAILVVAGDKLNAVEFLERRLRRKKREVELVTIQTRYPLGMEKQLIRAVTGREVSPGQSALDVGCAVFNVATVYAIRHALLTGEPLTHRAVTVSGGAVARPRNLWVPIGTPLRCLLQAAGGLREEAAITLTGGPMNGMIQENLDAPVVKNTNALAVPHGPGTQRQPAGDGVRQVRSLRLRLSHGLKPRSGLPGHAPGGEGAAGQPAPGGLYGLRVLLLHLPLPHSPDGPDAPGQERRCIP